MNIIKASRGRINKVSRNCYLRDKVMFFMARRGRSNISVMKNSSMKLEDGAGEEGTVLILYQIQTAVSTPEKEQRKKDK